MAGFSDCFCGKVEQREYSQFLSKEQVPTLIVDGKPVSWKIVTSMSKTNEKTFRFEGLTASQADETGSVEVTDVSGTSYTVPLQSEVTDGSTGTAIFVSHEVQVTRRRMTTHMWEVTVVVRDSQLLQRDTNAATGA